MEKNKILIYGANGYMGKLLTEYFSNSNFNIILAARNDFETNLPKRIFPLDQKSKILENLNEVKLVINLAGPFKNTCKQLVEACIENGSHYIDIAGEYNELELVYSFNDLAKKANVMLMPGAGFGVVPTDIVANIAKSKLPDAKYLKIAYITNGGASRGTLKTVLSEIHKDGVILENGSYKKASPAFKNFNLKIKNKSTKLVYNPWRADLFSAKISTGIQNIETYANFPGFVVKMMQGKLLWLRDFMLKRLINLLPIGPSKKQLEKGSTICYAEVSNNYQVASATIFGPEAYVFTASTLLEISKRVMNNDFQSGYQTPNIYGITLIKDIPNVIIE